VTALLSSLREGDFLTRDRIRLWTSVVLFGFAAAIAFLILSAHDGTDYQGRPLGTDFSSFYAAGRLALQGLSPFDQVRLHDMQQALFGEQTPYYAFSYPPIFLLIAAPLAKLPYLAALILWQVCGVALYAAAMLRLRRRYGEMVPDTALYLAAVLAFTATLANLMHGQNGFLSAGLMTLAIGYLEVNAVLSGICFGLLAFKPQLGLLVPIALAAGGYWRAFASAAACVVAASVVSAFAFGLGDWQGFLATASFSRHAILDREAVGYYKMTSVFAWARIWGAPLYLSYLAQGVVTLAVAAAIVRTWRSNIGVPLKGVLLCLGTLLVTPFAFDYDLLMLAPAMALLTFEGLASAFRPYERTLLAALWFVPLLTRSVAYFTHVPLGAPLMLIAFAAVLAHGGSAGIVRRTEIPA
jgi:hypothetical protein